MISFPEFFKRAPFAILVIGDDTIIDCNPAFIKLIRGRSGKEVVGKSVKVLLKYRVDKAPTVNPALEKEVLFKSSGERKYSAILCYKRVEVPVTVNVITDETNLVKDQKQYLVINPDLHDQMKEGGEKAQLHPTNAFSSFVESSPDVIMEFDKELRHIYVNKKAAEQTGIPVEKFIGKTHHELNFPPHLIKLFDESLKKVFKTGKENRVEFALNPDTVIDWYLVPQFDEEGQVASVKTTARDITGLKKTEEALIDSQNKLLDAMKLARLASWTYDIKKDSLFLSAQFGSIIGEDWARGYSLSLKEYIKKYIYPPDQERILAAVQEGENSAFKYEKNTFEYRLVKKDGELANLFNIFSIKYDKNNNPVLFDGIIQDISLLRNIEAELQEHHQNLEKLIALRTEELKRSEEKLSDALKLAKLTTWEFDFKSKKYFAGGEIEEILGPVSQMDYNIADIKHFEKLIHPDDLPVYFGSFERALRATSEDYLDYIEYRIIRADGDIRHLYLSIKVEIGADGRHTRHYGTIQDISSIRKAEEEKERLTAIIEVTPDIVAIVDPNGKLIYLNESGRFFFGLLNPEDIEDVNFIDIQTKETEELLKNTGFPAATHTGLWTGESELQGKNNQTVPVSLAIVAHFGQDGMVTSYFTIIRNISAQKKTEQDLIYKNAELDTFVYRASHDLRGPISSLLGLYQIVQYEIKEKRALEFFDMFNKQILRLNEIILALINLTKIKESQVSEAPINFTGIVHDAIESFRHLPGFSGIKFKVKIDVKKEFKSDKSLVTTIVQNLIENAIKYSRRNTEAFANVAVESKRNDLLIIRVEDNGIGIGKDIQNRIFDMFFRGHEVSKGSGLGLYILKNAVEKLHGKITLESEAGQGTTFTIELPYTY